MCVCGNMKGCGDVRVRGRGGGNASETREDVPAEPKREFLSSSNCVKSSEISSSKTQDVRQISSAGS